ncbi:hypothetical protein [Gracilimonas sp.]|uniref:hypothetical protein n=1 Tax=Gracilimonas sp. TaxID=1974203 RepID=UPI0032EAF079
MKIPSILIYTLSAILLASCADWKQKERIAGPVWSDDDSEIAFILNRYEYRRNQPTGGDIKNKQYSIFLTDEEFDSDFELTDNFEGLGEDLFYMKEAGYIVSGSFSEQYHVINTSDGELLQTFSPADTDICGDKIGDFQTINVIPSINGDRLAVLETRSDCTIDIAFWEEGNGQWTQQTIFDVPGNDFDGAAWIGGERLLVSVCEEFCSEKFYLIHPTEGESVVGQRDNFPDPCLFVSTASSWINESGQFVYVDENRELSIASIWEDEELISSYPDFNEEYYQPGCSNFD